MDCLRKVEGLGIVPKLFLLVTVLFVIIGSILAITLRVSRPYEATATTESSETSQRSYHIQRRRNLNRLSLIHCANSAPCTSKSPLVESFYLHNVDGHQLPILTCITFGSNVTYIHVFNTNRVALGVDTSNRRMKTATFSGSITEDQGFQWYITLSHSGNYRKIINRATGLALDSNDEGSVYVHPVNDGDFQDWSFLEA